MYPPSSPPHIFISYARSDGEDFARLLRLILTEEYGFGVWQDRTEMQVGEAWWQQIVAALTNEHVEYMVLVMTPAAMDSEMVRKEWRLARQEGVCVLPVIASPDLDFQSLPPGMGAVHFTDPDIDEEWTRFIRTLEGHCQEKRVPYMVKDLPGDFVQRPNKFNEIVTRLLDEKREDVIATTVALRGAGGYGKTTLAKAICYNERILDTFYDGILWVTLGENPGDLTIPVNDLIETLSGKRPGFECLDAATSHLKGLLADRHILIVIDDVWNGVHLNPFVQGGMHCARLTTTRDSSTLPPIAERIPVDAMQKDEAVELLKRGLPPADGEALQRLAAELGKWPLLLKLANSALREHVSLGMGVDRALNYVNEELSELGMTAFDAEDPQSRDQAMAATLSLSLKYLSEAERARYSELAIFPEDVDIPLSALEKLWGVTGGLKPVHITRLCLKLYNRLSLLYTYDAANQIIRLYDVVRRYLIKEQEEKLPSIYEQFLDAYGLGKWIDIPANETYLWDHLAYHLVEAGREEELQQLLLDFDWMQAKLAATEVNSLISDYDYLPDNSNLRLVQDAMRQSAHVLARDKTQLAGQLLGRLQSFQETRIQSILKQARGWNGSLWLCPLTASLTSVDGPLIRTGGHTEWISSVAITPDGRYVVSASYDNTLKVWDIKNGEELRTLRGHTNEVNAVAVTSDGRCAISASGDSTLKVWDIESGEELRTLKGHTGPVRAVIVTLDGRYILSVSDDRTIKVWDIESGEELLTLEGHTDKVNAVTVTPDSRYGISVSDDKTLGIWDIKNGKGLRTLKLKGHANWVNAVAVTPDGRCAISASGDSTLKVWDIKNGEELRTLRGHTNEINAVAVTPDGRCAISASDDSTLKVWDIERGDELRTLKDHTGPVRVVVVTLDGRYTLSTSDDMVLKVWDIESGKLIASFSGAAYLTACAISPDGVAIVLGEASGRVHLLRLMGTWAR